MESVFNAHHFAVFDEFLPKDSFREVSRYLQTDDMETNAAKQVWRLLDGDSATGPTVASKMLAPSARSLSYPSGRATDLVIEELKKVLPDLESWTGKQGVDWDYFSCTPSIYPQGSGLSWHRDRTHKTASVVLYVHPEWRPTWGAELLISGPAGCGCAALPVLPAQKMNGSTGMPCGDDPMHRGIGHYIAPRPNRLVVIKSGAYHTVKRVDVRAGENVRASMAGFFHSIKPQG